MSDQLSAPHITPHKVTKSNADKLCFTFQASLGYGILFRDSIRYYL